MFRAPPKKESTKPKIGGKRYNSIDSKKKEGKLVNDTDPPKGSFNGISSKYKPT